MQRLAVPLLNLKERYGAKLILRVSIDYYSQTLHETERGKRSWTPAMQGLKWLSRHGFSIQLAGRTCWGESPPWLLDTETFPFDQASIKTG